VLEFLKKQIDNSNIEKTQEIAKDANDNEHGRLLLQRLLIPPLICKA